MKTTFTLLFSLLIISAWSQVPVMNPVSGSATVCTGSSHIYTTSASNSPTSYSWSISPMTGASYTAAGNHFTVSFTGQVSTYTVSVTATNGSGSSQPVTQVITVWETPQVTFSGYQQGYCAGSGAGTLIQGSPTMFSGSSTLSYSWTPSTGLSSTTGSSVLANPSVSTNYTVFMQASSCMSYSVLPVTVHPAAVLNYTLTDYTICNGHSTTLTLSGNVQSYQLNGNPVNSPHVLTLYTPTLYQLIGSTSAGCVATHIFSVQVHPATQVSVSVQNNICIGQSATFMFGGNAILYEVNGTPQTSPFVVTPTVTTNYTVTGLDANGCVSSPQLHVVNVSPMPTLAAVSSHTLLCKGQTATVTINGNATTYSVNNVQKPSTFTLSPATTTTYNLAGVNSAGCKTSTSFVQQVDACQSVHKNAAKDELLIYPNPSAGEVHLKSFEPLQVVIYDQLGRQVKRLVLAAGEPAQITDLHPGIYMIKTEEHTHRLIISK